MASNGNNNTNKECRPCTEAQICNPASGRCVLRTGRVGRRVLASSRSPAVEQQHINMITMEPIPGGREFTKVITVPGGVIRRVHDVHSLADLIFYASRGGQQPTWPDTRQAMRAAEIAAIQLQAVQTRPPWVAPVISNANAAAAANADAANADAAAQAWAWADQSSSNSARSNSARSSSPNSSRQRPPMRLFFFRGAVANPEVFDLQTITLGFRQFTLLGRRASNYGRTLSATNRNQHTELQVQRILGGAPRTGVPYDREPQRELVHTWAHMQRGMREIQYFFRSVLGAPYSARARPGGLGFGDPGITGTTVRDAILQYIAASADMAHGGRGRMYVSRGGNPEYPLVYLYKFRSIAPQIPPQIAVAVVLKLGYRHLYIAHIMLVVDEACDHINLFPRRELLAQDFDWDAVNPENYRFTRSANGADCRGLYQEKFSWYLPQLPSYARIPEGSMNLPWFQ